MVIVSPPQAITCGILLVAIVIGERSTTTLSGGCVHAAGLADTQLVTVECMEQVTADVQDARRVASRVSNRVSQPGAIMGIQTTDRSYRLLGRYRLSAIADNLGRFARFDRDRGAVGHCAQRRLHAIQTLSQLSYSPTVSCSIRADY
jgi:hypothetical protein